MKKEFRKKNNQLIWKYQKAFYHIFYEIVTYFLLTFLSYLLSFLTLPTLFGNITINVVSKKMEKISVF